MATEYFDVEPDGEQLTTRGTGNMAVAQKLFNKSMEAQGGKDQFDSACDSGILSADSICLSEEFKQSLKVSETVSRKSDITEMKLKRTDGDSVDEITKQTESMKIDEDEGLCLSCESSYNSDNISKVHNVEIQTAKPRKATNVNDRITDEALEVYGKDRDGDTLLHVAIIHAQTYLCMFFIQIAPWFDWLDIYNNKLHQTPLHLAVLVGLKDVARRLVIGGANTEMRDHNGDTPLHIACREGNFEMAEVLLTPVSTEEIEQNEYEIPSLNVPQNLELRNCSGNTCLHEAVLNQKYDILKLLLDKGANVNAKDGKQGATILHYAAVSGNETLTGFLLGQRGVKVDCKMYNGATPAMLAHNKGQFKVFNSLVKRGANSDIGYQSSSSDDEDLE